MYKISQKYYIFWIKRNYFKHIGSFIEKLTQWTQYMDDILKIVTISPNNEEDKYLKEN